ncbi:MAG: hypothetical protein EOM37_14650 [Proteobacteria bacterium]|nr:hypothetical protein [Pseudomonadota bacterium]
MEFTRNLKKGMSGEDVRAVKERLVTLGYLYAATKLTFGSDTLKAVKAFQAANGLETDGVVGILTLSALFNDDVDKPTVEAEIVPERFSPAARMAIGTALAQVSDIRREICLDALQFAVEAEEKPASMLAFYIRGGNMYNKDLTLNVMTESKLKAYFAKDSYAPYFDGGRDDLMMETAMRSMFQCPGWDCSGMIVGLMRKHGIYDSGFDANANTLGASHTVRTDNPQAGDWACKSGHIGLYVGGGYAVESVGGAFGVQLTKIKKRLVYDFQYKKLRNYGTWEYFGDPKRY